MSSKWFSNWGQVFQILLSVIGTSIALAGYYTSSHFSGIPNWTALYISVALLVFVAGALARKYFKQPLSIPLHRFARRSDLPELHQFYTKCFGLEETPTLPKMRAWHSQNREIFHIIWNIDPTSHARTIVASIRIIPLARDAVPCLQMGSLTGNTLLKSHIACRGAKVYGWYIGGLVSTSKGSRTVVLKELVEYLTENLQPDTPIFARALTNKGLELLRDFRFSRVNKTGNDNSDSKIKLGEVCSLLRDDLPELIRALRSPHPRRLRPTRTLAARAKRQAS